MDEGAVGSRLRKVCRDGLLGVVKLKVTVLLDVTEDLNLGRGHFRIV